MAQNTQWDEVMQELTEEFGTAYNEETSEQWQAQMDELTDLHEHPLDINSSSKNDLLQIPFLTETEVDDILNYRERNGSLHSLGEFILIPSISAMHRRWLHFFLVVRESDATTPSPSYHIDSKQEISTRIDIPLYRRAGWPWQQGIANRLSYNGHFGKHWEIGLRAEKDAGEPMFTRQNPLWDAWGGYAMYKDWKCVQTLIVGDYKATFGEGLVLNNGFQLGKQTTGLWRQSATLRPHRSFEESRFLRGAAATLRFGTHWNITALFSHRLLDATVQADNTVMSINTTGLHRTAAELSHKATLGSYTTALHVGWKNRALRIGASATYLYYDHLFRQGTALYRQIYPEGYQFTIAGINYGAHVSNLYISGETAVSQSATHTGTATLNKAIWRFNSNTQLALIQRYYSQDFCSPLAMAFGENSRVQNESGLCLLLDAERLGAFSVHALFDYFYHPWPRYTMTRYSQGCEGAVRITFQPQDRQQWQLWYSLKNKESNDRRHFSHRLRASFSQLIGQRWALQAAALYHHYMEPALHQHSNGLAFVPKVTYATTDERWRYTLTLASFNTKDYNSRLYVYEPGLTQSFGWNMLSGKGERIAATARWNFHNTTGNSTRHRLTRWDLQTKIGITHYRDRNSISSGALLINGSWQADVWLFLRCRFS